MRDTCKQIADARWFQHAITFTILLASVLVGVQTYELSSPDIRAAAKTLDLIDQIILWIFVLEIGIKMGAEGSKPWQYFRDPWNVFDFTIVAVCFLPFQANMLRFFACCAYCGCLNSCAPYRAYGSW